MNFTTDIVVWTVFAFIFGACLIAADLCYRKLIEQRVREEVAEQMAAYVAEWDER